MDKKVELKPFAALLVAIALLFVYIGMVAPIIC